MRNNVTYSLNGEDEGEESEVDTDALQEVIGDMVGRLIGDPTPTTEMPVIRKKPDLTTFRDTMLYREIKALCGLRGSNRRPSDRWSLTRSLMKRENGLGVHPSGIVTANQQRRIANLFVPNKKEERLMSLESKVFICKFNPDGSRLITACQDSIVRVFDSSKGTYHRINRVKAKDVNWSILDIDFSPCGNYFAYSTWSEYFFVVPLNSNGEDFEWLDLHINQNRTGIFSLRFSPCGNRLIGGCNNSCVYIYDRETRVSKKVKAQRHFHINAVSFVHDKDPNLFVTGCSSGILKLWDMRCIDSGRNTHSGTFIGHMDGITYIDPRNDGNYILTNSKDQSIKIWDLRRTTPRSKVDKCLNLPLLEWDYRWDAVPRKYYNPIRTLDGDVSIMTYRGHRVTKSLLRAKFSPAVQTGQRYIYTGCGTGRIIIYDVLTGTIKEAIEGHKDIVRDLDWHPVRSEIVSSSWDSHVNLNTFKRNILHKRTSSEHLHGPLRRSRRIANQFGELSDEDGAE